MRGNITLCDTAWMNLPVSRHRSACWSVCRSWARQCADWVTGSGRCMPHGQRPSSERSSGKSPTPSCTVLWCYLGFHQSAVMTKTSYLFKLSYYSILLFLFSDNKTHIWMTPSWTLTQKSRISLFRSVILIGLSVMIIS